MASLIYEISTRNITNQKNLNTRMQLSQFGKIDHQSSLKLN